MRYRAEGENRLAFDAFGKANGEAIETKSNFAFSQFGGGMDGLVEELTAVAERPDAASMVRTLAFLAANLLRRRRTGRRSVAYVASRL